MSFLQVDGRIYVATQAVAASQIVATNRQIAKINGDVSVDTNWTFAQARGRSLAVVTHSAIRGDMRINVEGVEWVASVINTISSNAGVGSQALYGTALALNTTANFWRITTSTVPKNLQWVFQFRRSDDQKLMQIYAPKAKLENYPAPFTDGDYTKQSLAWRLSPSTTATFFEILHAANIQGGAVAMESIFNVKDYNATGDGVTDDYSDVNDTHVAATVNGGFIYFPVGTYKLGSSITFNNNVTLVFAPGAKLSMDSTKTATINGDLIPTTHQIFSGAGTVTFGSGGIPQVIPQWWGAVGDDSTDCHDAIEAAITAASKIGTVYLPAGIYRITDTIDNFPYGFPTTPTTAINIQGAGNSRTVIKYTPATGYAVAIYNTDLDTITNFRAVNDVTISDLQIVAPSSTTGGGLDIPGGKRNTIERVIVTDIDNSSGTAVRIRRRPYIQTEAGMTNDANKDFTTSGGATEKYAIAFTTPAVLSGKVKEVTVRLGKTGSPAGTVTATIYSDSSGPDAIIGAASGTVSANALNAAADGADVTFTFAWADTPAITASTKYWIVLETSGYTYSDGVTEIRLRVEVGAGGTDEFATYDGGGASWSTSNDGANNIVEIGQDSAQMIAFRSVQIQDSSKAAIGIAVNDDSQLYMSDCNIFAVAPITGDAPTIRATRCNIASSGGRTLNILNGTTSWAQCYMEGSSGAATGAYFGAGRHVYVESNMGFVDRADGVDISFVRCRGPLYTNSTDPTMIPQDELMRIYTTDTPNAFTLNPTTISTTSDANSLTGTVYVLTDLFDTLQLQWDATTPRQYKRLALGTYQVAVTVRDAGTPGAGNFQVYAWDTTTSDPNRFMKASPFVGAAFDTFYTHFVIDSAHVDNRIGLDFQCGNAASIFHLSDVIVKYLGPDIMSSETPIFNVRASDADGARASKIPFLGRRSGDEMSYLAVIKASHDGAGDDEKGKLEFAVNLSADAFNPSTLLTLDSNGEIGLSGTVVDHGAVGAMAGHETFDRNDGNLFIKDPDGSARNFNPTGTFSARTQVTVINTANGAETITFDSGGLNQAIAQNERGIFAFDGSNWLKVYVGS